MLLRRSSRQWLINLPSWRGNSPSFKQVELLMLFQRLWEEQQVPYMKNGKRDYKRENELYNSRPEQVKARTERNQARSAAKKAGINVAGKDVDHKRALSKGGSNSLSNLHAVSASSNRSFSRNKDGSMKSQRSRKGK